MIYLMIRLLLKLTADLDNWTFALAYPWGTFILFTDLLAWLLFILFVSSDNGLVYGLWSSLSNVVGFWTSFGW